MLLNYPKLDLLDCKRHKHVTYLTHEEAMLATRYFSSDDEATRVMDELVALRCPAAQLRFAFAVLLDKDAAPVTLYTKDSLSIPETPDPTLPSTSDKQECAHDGPPECYARMRWDRTDSSSSLIL